MLFYTSLKGIHINLYTCKGLLFCLSPGIVKTVVIGKLNPQFIRNDNSVILYVCIITAIAILQPTNIFLNFIYLFIFTLQYWFCHTST